jgi:hypothetical protein
MFTGIHVFLNYSNQMHDRLYYLYELDYVHLVGVINEYVLTMAGPY